MGQDVVSLVKYFFRYSFPLYRINQTFIVLTPKKSIPQNVNNLRPITLCNVIYKIIYRFKTFLFKIIGPYQSAFIEGRHIAGNYIIVHEILHSLEKEQEKTIGLETL